MSQQPEEFSNLIPLGPNQPEHAQDEIISQEGINGLNRNDPNRSMVILNNIDGKKTEGKTESKNERPDNLRRTAFIILMVHLKILLKFYSQICLGWTSTHSNVKRFSEVTLEISKEY